MQEVINFNVNYWKGMSKIQSNAKEKTNSNEAVSDQGYAAVFRVVKCQLDTIRQMEVPVVKTTQKDDGKRGKADGVAVKEICEILNSGTSKPVQYCCYLRKRYTAASQ